MEICVVCFDGEKCTVEVGVDDTTADIRRKVASAAELCEDGFDISFGGKVMAEGDTTQLSAGDTVVLTKKTMSQKDSAIAALRDLGETALTAERFDGLADPNLVRLFLQAEVVTEIPYGFLRGGAFEELHLSDVSVVTTMGSHFLDDCRSLHTVDLSGWHNVIQLGERAFFCCSSLTTLDMSGWSSVTQIGSNFLSGQSSLTTLDLSGWISVTHIGDRFLYGCTLSTLDLSGWYSVAQIGNNFMSGHSSLTTLDFSGWSSVTHIGSNFLSGCSALSRLDLSGWHNVTQLEERAFFCCSSLTTLDMSGWSSVTHIGDNFVSHCRSLRTLDWSGWASVTHIGKGVFDASNLRKCSINVTGSSSAVLDLKKKTFEKKRPCMCM